MHAASGKTGVFAIAGGASYAVNSDRKSQFTLHEINALAKKYLTAGNSLLVSIKPAE